MCTDAKEGAVMNWSDLKLLLEFHEEGTLESVARLHGITASTVSRRIRALEESIDVRFVENVSGRLVLTSAGERAVAAAEAMRGHSDSMLREVIGKDAEIRGVIRIGLLGAFIHYHADAFASFSSTHPDVELELLEQGARLHNLTQRDADVVLRATRTPQDTLIGRPLLTMTYAPFIRPDLAPEKFDPKELSWIAWHEMLNASESDAWLREHARHEHIVARVTSTMAMIDLASAGMGACIIPVIHGHAAGLQQLTEPLETFTTRIWMLTHRDLAGHARIRALMEHLTTYFKNYPDR